MTQSGTDGLGINGLVGDDSEVGIGEFLRVTFAAGSGNGLTGAWLTKLFTGEPGLLGPITEAGYVSLYVGGSFLKDVAFSGLQTVGQNSLGDVYADFGGALDLSEARFYSGQLFNGILVNDYSVAGLQVPAPVADGGLSLGLLGGAYWSRRAQPSPVLNPFLAGHLPGDEDLRGGGSLGGGLQRNNPSASAGGLFPFPG